MIQWTKEKTGKLHDGHRQMGQHYMKTGNFEDIYVSMILRSVQSDRAAQCVRKRGRTKWQTAWVTALPTLLYSILH